MLLASAVANEVPESRAPQRMTFAALFVAASMISILIVQQFALGRSPFGEPGEWQDVWVAVVHVLLATYLPFAYLTILKSGQQSERELARELNTRCAGEVALLPPFDRPTRGWLAAGLLTCTLTFFGPWLTEPSVAGPLYFWRPSHWSIETYWHRIISPWIGLWLGWFGYALVHVSMRFSCLARTLCDFSLFDGKALRPFVRYAVRNGMMAAGTAVLFGLFGMDMGMTLMLAVFGGLTLTLVTAAVVLPVWGVVGKMRAARNTELAWCDRAIEAERNHVRRGEAALPGTLADLIAYRALVNDVNTWPLDTPALRRVVLYMVVPLISWVGSAWIQQIVQEAIDR